MSFIHNISIPGWMSEEELDYIASLASKVDELEYILEIGVWKGRTTFTICSNTKAYVDAVDNWKGSKIDSVNYRELNEGVNVEEIAKENLAKFLVNDFEDAPQLFLKRQDSTEYLQETIKVSSKYKLIFIDGDHEYTQVVRDIVLSQLVLAPGGVLAGDDYDFPQVRAAVDSFVSKPINPVGKIWVESS